MKRTLQLALLLAVIAVFGTLWFLENFEQVEIDAPIGAGMEARRNPWLAMERFLARMGMRVRVVERPSELDPPAPGSTLILMRSRAMVTPERVGRLLAWVAAGGHVIVEPELTRHRDPLLDALRIERGDAKGGAGARLLEVEVPTSVDRLRIETGSGQTLDPGRTVPQWIVSDAAGVRIASFTRGAGQVSVVTGFGRFSNRRIGQQDNARFLWALMQIRPGTGEVLLLKPGDAPSLWTWLVESAAEALTAAAALIVLWLWRTLPRFGPIRPEPAPERKQLLEHILACGRFRWSQGGRAPLMEAAREQCLARILAVQPRLAHLDATARSRELAAMIAADAAEIAYAFEGAPRNAHEFVAAVRTLARVHDGLVRPTRTIVRKRAR